MKNNDFKELQEQFSSEWVRVTKSTSLEDVQKNLAGFNIIRENVLNWIFEKVQDEDGQAEYISSFGELEINLLREYGAIPVFDSKFDINQSFVDYSSYYQRYGCLAPDFVVSWDTENVLWVDDDDNGETIKRPDVLMGNLNND